MWILLLIVYGVFVCVLIGSATYVALRCPDPSRRKDAYRVLVVLMTLATGSGGIAGVVRLLIGFKLMS
jgi:hypothetical protein